MRRRIIQIGSSRGIRLPKAVLKRAHFTEEVEIDVNPGKIVIRSAHVPREGWEKAFRGMAERGDDILVEGESEWQW